MAIVIVERPGLLTTVQDEGRWGYQALGVPVSGAMDVGSARAANGLVGNGPDAAVLEVTLLGPALRFAGSSRIAIVGAAFDVRIGDRGLHTPLVETVADGQVVAFGARRAGCRAYVAVRGGFQTASTLGSRSTHVRTGLGGRPLKRGDALQVGAIAEAAGGALEGLPPVALPGAESRLRLLPGAVDDDWSRRVRMHLRQQPYRVAPASDRMGYRLEGPAPWPDAAAGLVSTPVVTGAIQVPPGGQPILLMADRQTTGGYAVVGVVCEVDLGLAAQLAPGDRIGFGEIDLPEALAASAARREAFERWLGAA